MMFQYLQPTDPPCPKCKQTARWIAVSGSPNQPTYVQTCACGFKEEKEKPKVNGCGAHIVVRENGRQHGSFCGCNYKGLHLCDLCKNKENEK